MKISDFLQQHAQRFAKIWRRSSTVERGLLTGLVILMIHGGLAWGGDGQVVADVVPGVEAVVKIQAREFQPNRVSIPLGQKTKLILRNQDAELHAFVPVGLFVRTSATVGGNGAPQFGPDGLLRVLIPAEGHSEIVFVPKKPGVFPFFCDLPGHVMNGTVVVEE